MKVLISEAQKQILYKYLKNNELNEAIGNGFSFGYLKTLPTFKARLQFCKQCLGNPIGKGSSRVVFQIDDEWCLKLALNEKGIAQNIAEGQPDYYKDSMCIFPEKQLDFSDLDNYTFLVSEYVLPVKKADFKECLNMTFDDYMEFVIFCWKESHSWSRFVTSYMDSDTAYDLIENNEFFHDLHDYIGNYSIPYGDLVRTANLGLVQRDGQPCIVILDSGFNEDVAKMY